MNAKGFETLGIRLAKVIFDKRSEGRRYRTSEAHLREAELAAIIALAVEEGYKRGLSEGKGQPHPEGVVTAHGRLVALAGPAATEKTGEATGGPCSPESLARLPKGLPRTKQIGGSEAHLARHPTTGAPVYVTVPERDE